MNCAAFKKRTTEVKLIWKFVALCENDFQEVSNAKVLGTGMLIFLLEGNLVYTFKNTVQKKQKLPQ